MEEKKMIVKLKEIVIFVLFVHFHIKVPRRELAKWKDKKLLNQISENDFAECLLYLPKSTHSVYLMVFISRTMHTKWESLSTSNEEGHLCWILKDMTTSFREKKDIPGKRRNQNKDKQV